MTLNYTKVISYLLISSWFYFTEDLSENDKETTHNSATASGQPSYDTNLHDNDREENYGSKMNGQYNSYKGDITAASRTLMISGIPSTYCTKEFLQRHFQVR